MEEEQAKQRSERLARKVLNRWMNRRVLAALYTWKSQMMLHTSHYGQENRKRAEEELSKHKKNMEGYVVRQMDNMDVRRRLTTTRDVFATWKARWAHKKSQDAKVKSAKQKLAHGKQKRVIQALRDRTEYQKKLRRFEKRLKSFDTRTVLEKYFKSLKELMKVPKVMAKKVVLFAEKMKFLMKAEAFRRVSEYKIEKEGNMRGKLRDMCTTIQSAQREVDKMWLVVAFGEILRISRRRSLRGTILMNKMANLQKTLLRKSFNQITFFSKIQRTIIKNNYIGPQAQENQRLARKAKSLRRFFTKEGYTDQEVNDHIKVKDSGRVAFARLKTLVVEEEKPENPFLLHRMFKKWTHFTKDSVLLKKFIKTIENYKYKSELYHPFKVWKSATKHEVQAPKPEMIRMLKHQTEQVKRLAAERTAKAEAVENLRAQHDYYSNYQPGIKKIAIFTFTRAFSKTMKGHMQRWKSYVNACQEEEYRQLIGGADSKIKELEDLLFVKHEAIKMIQDENKNIREVCFEGTKTAKELKALMEERDKVSVSLTDKIAYIQELLQENAILNNKIKTAQQEAIQLLALTKQFTGDETPR